MNSPRYHPIMRYIARHTTATFGIPFEYLPYSGYCQPSGDFSPIVPNSPFSPKSPLSRGLAIFLHFYQICHFRQNRHSLSPKSLLSKGPILASNLNRHHSGVFFFAFFPIFPIAWYSGRNTNFAFNNWSICTPLLVCYRIWHIIY